MPEDLGETKVQLPDGRELGQNLDMENPVCVACGTSVVRLPVHEGDKLFHVDCYVAYKRRAMPAPELQPSRQPRPPV